MTQLTNRSAAFAVIIAFAFGMIATLALRPTGSSIQSSPTSTNDAIAEVRWRMPVAFATNLPVLGDNVLYVTRTLSEASNGRIILQPYEPGEIVPALNILDAVREGKVPAGYTWAGYDQGKIPASPLIGAVPFGMEPWEFSAWWFEAGGQDLAKTLYGKYNVHPILCGIIGPETAGWFRKPINSLDDIQGLKIRFAGLGGQVIERLGASVTMIPGGEIFQALEKGAIDATEYSLPSVDAALGFDRITRLNYFPGWHQPFTAAHLMVNKATWDALASAQKTIIEMSCTAGVTRNLARSEGLQGEILANYENRGITASRFPESVLRKLNQVSDEVLAEEARRDVDFRIIHESQLEFRKSYAYWKKLAYLPRDF